MTRLDTTVPLTHSMPQVPSCLFLHCLSPPPLLSAPPDSSCHRFASQCVSTQDQTAALPANGDMAVYTLYTIYFVPCKVLGKLISDYLQLYFPANLCRVNRFELQMAF